MTYYGSQFIYHNNMSDALVERQKIECLKNALYNAAKQYKEGDHFVVRVTSETTKAESIEETEYRVMVETKAVEYMDVRWPRVAALDYSTMKQETFWTRLRNAARYMLGKLE